MSKITIIGASGFVGSALVDEALSRGIAVRALVRHPEKIALRHEKLQIEAVDVFDVEALSELLRGADAVLSAYNPGWTNINIARDTQLGYRSILEAAKKAEVKRLLIVGGAGSLFVAPGKTVIDAGVIPAEILPGVEALATVLTDDLRTEREIDWVFFSPAGTLEPGTRTGNYRLGADDLIVDAAGHSRISVEDYAKAMIDEFETPQHHQTRFTIGY